MRDLNIVVASDIHLGKIIGHSRLAEMVERINALHPDLVLFPGDLVDEGGDHLAEGKIVETLRTIRSRFGVFAVTGNHEYYSGLRNALAMMRKGNVKVLEDAVVKVAEAFYLIGRKDRTEDRYGTGRKPLHELIQYVDRRYPVILMDHQPFHLEEASAHGVDLQVSGHTHHGQMFPFNHITRAVYEMSWGYLSKGKTHYYVSCGLGTWGPPVRIGSVPEIVQIKVTFRPR